MKLLLIGGLVGLIIGVVLTVLYFSLDTFFAVNAKALNENAVDATAIIGRRKAGDRRKAG